MKYLKNTEGKSICVIDSRDDVAPFLTVIVPTYKRPEFLAQTLESLYFQTSKKFEVIIVDNDPDQEFSAEVEKHVESFHGSIKAALYRNEANLGMFGNWNIGLELARTNLVTILHDDDLLHELFVEKVVSIIEKNKNIDLLAVGVKVFFGREFYTPEGSVKDGCVSTLRRFKDSMINHRLVKLNGFDYFLGNQHAGTLGVVFSKPKALAIGGFGEDYGPSSDYAFFSKYCLTYGSSYFFKRGLTFYRVAVNESLSFDTMVNFVDNDIKLRKFLSASIKFGSFLEFFLSRAISAARIKRLSDFNPHDPNLSGVSDQLRRKFGFGLIFFMVASFMVRAMLNVCDLRAVFYPRLK